MLSFLPKLTIANSFNLLGRLQTSSSSVNKYNFDHLIQSDKQDVLGPIQDDEALFLYSIIRGCRLSRVLEIGGF